MSGWTPTTPWRIIEGSGQSLSVTSAQDNAFTTALGSQTRAVYISVITGNCLVRISEGGIAATATGDALVKSTDPPQIFGCTPGDKLHVWGLATATAYICELTH